MTFVQLQATWQERAIGNVRTDISVKGISPGLGLTTRWRLRSNEVSRLQSVHRCSGMHKQLLLVDSHVSPWCYASGKHACVQAPRNAGSQESSGSLGIIPSPFKPNIAFKHVRNALGRSNSDPDSSNPSRPGLGVEQQTAGSPRS